MKDKKIERLAELATTMDVWGEYLATVIDTHEVSFGQWLGAQFEEAREAMK